MCWNFSMSSESGEMFAIKPLPHGANLILDRNWLTFVSRPAPTSNHGYPLTHTADGFIIDDDIPF